MLLVALSILFCAVPLSFDSETLASVLPITVGTVLSVIIGEVLTAIREKRKHTREIIK